MVSGLNDRDTEAVARVVDLLEARGVALGYPHTNAIVGSAMAMRELRVQSGGRPLRVLYAFDPKRKAYLLLGGEKGGDDRFYQRMIPIAEAIYKRHLAERIRDSLVSREIMGR